MKKHLAYFVVFVFSLLLLTSCGYHIGSIAHPQIKTIAIAPVKNETYIPNAAEYMRQALSESFQKDGSWKVKEMNEWLNNSVKPVVMEKNKLGKVLNGFLKKEGVNFSRVEELFRSYEGTYINRNYY